MANPCLLNKYFKEIKIICSLLGAWPFAKGDAAKYKGFILFLHGFILLTLMVKY